jgi:hypothetical protein
MWLYIKYLFKLYFGFLIIIAIDGLIRKNEPSCGYSWFFLTLAFYNGYCYLEYRLNDKDNDKL